MKFLKLCDYILEEDLSAVDIYGPTFLQRLKLMSSSTDNEIIQPEINDIVYLEINGNLDPQYQDEKITSCGIYKIEKITKKEINLVPYYEVYTDKKFNIEIHDDIKKIKYPEEPIIKIKNNNKLDDKQYKDIGKIIPDEKLNKPITIDLENSKIIKLPHDSNIQPKWYIKTCMWKPWDPNILNIDIKEK